MNDSWVKKQKAVCLFCFFKDGVNLNYKAQNNDNGCNRNTRGAIYFFGVKYSRVGAFTAT
jgi:hypothetical protein